MFAPRRMEERARVADGGFRFRSVRPDMPPPESWADFVAESYEGQRFTNFGPLSLRLEEGLRERYGAPEGRCVLASSATAALAACLIAHQVRGPVLLPAFTFPATLSAIRMAGAVPVLVDVDPVHWSVTAEILDAALEKTRAQAAMVVVPFGLRQELGDLVEVCRRRGVLLVIDNAAGLGLERAPIERNERVLEVFSLHATKPFAIGEGGAIFAAASDEGRLRSAMNFALDSYLDPRGPSWGLNGKVSELHAAIGLAQLARFDERLRLRRRAVARHLEVLAEHDGFVYPREVDAAPWQVFPVLAPSSERTEQIVRAAAARGLELRRYYRPSLSRWTDVELAHPCPVSDSLSDRMFCLPVYAGATPSELDELSELISSALRSP